MKSEARSIEVMDGSASNTMPNTVSTMDSGTSEHDAMQLEQADLHEALIRSKADARNADGVIILRLTSHSPQIKEHLRSSDLLRAHVDSVRSAGCELCPEWGNGALLLIPSTR